MNCYVYASYADFEKKNFNSMLWNDENAQFGKITFC